MGNDSNRNAAKKLGKATLMVLNWILFAFIEGPFFLILDIVVSIAYFVSDVVCFPYNYGEEMQKSR